MGLFISRGFLDNIKADAIVNGTNTDKRWIVQRCKITSIRKDGAFCKKIFSSDCWWDSEEHRVRFSADGQVAELMRSISLLQEGESKIFLAEGISSLFRYQIVTAVPEWRGGKGNEKYLLRKCYENSLEVAIRKGCKSILFPQLGTGEHAFPPKVSLDIALSTLQDIVRNQNVDIYFMPADDLRVVERMQAGLGKIKRDLALYLNEHYTMPIRPPHRSCKRVIPRERDTNREQKTIPPEQMLAAKKEKSTLSKEERGERWKKRLPISAKKKKLPRVDFREISASYSSDIDVEEVKNLLPQKKRGELFWEYLQSLMARTGKSKVEIYKGANLDRRIFSKIRNTPDAIPSKRTVLALAIALQLSLEDTKAFLEQAGFAFSSFEKADVLIAFFIKNQMYDIQRINEVLYSFGESLLGSMSWEERRY